MSGLGYIDSNCYNCVVESKTYPPSMEVQAQCEYQGKGIFKCPKCGSILDLSESVYNIRIKATIEEGSDGSWIDFEIIEPYDPRIIEPPKRKNGVTIKGQMEDDLPENQEKWWDGSTGVFDLELYFLWSSSGYYEIEWDLDIIVLKKTPVESKETRKEKTMNEVQRIVAKRIIPMNIYHIENHIPELKERIPELEKILRSLESKEVRIQ